MSDSGQSADKREPGGISSHHHAETHDDDAPLLIGGMSPGVKRMEVLAQHVTLVDKICIMTCLFFVAFTYSLDGQLRYVYQPYATASFASHSTLATIGVLRSVIAAAAQPTAAKIADVFGRIELIAVSIFFYVLGTIVESTSKGVDAFSAGAVLYQIGYTMMILLVEVIIADLTSLRSRVFFSFVPAFPFVIITWVSGDISAAVLKVTTWRWGVGMWGIIYAFLCIPLMISLYIPQRRAKKAGALHAYKSSFQQMGAKKLAVQLFWQLDVPGIVLLIAVFALVLVPFTLAGGQASTSENWGKAKVIAPLIIGLLCIPVWIIWEKKAPHPMVPFHLLKDRGVWGALGIAWMLNFSWYMQGDFLYTVLIVGFNESVTSATRIASLFSFCSVLTGTSLGIVIYKVRYLKPFIVFGTMLWLVAFGLLIRFRGGYAGTSHSGVIGAQVLLGIAAGFFTYPAQASIQSNTKHEHMAAVTGLYLATYNIGSAFGAAVSGAIWTQTLVSTLQHDLPAPYNANGTTAKAIYADPFTYAANYTVGTPVRDGMVSSYRHIQRLLCVAGICLGVPLIGFALCLRNPRLGDEQSLRTAETEGGWERGRSGKRRVWEKVF